MEGEPSRTGYCVFECRAEEGNSGDEDQGFSSHELEVLDLAFFDDDTLLMVTRTIEPGLDETVLGELFTFENYVCGRVCVGEQPFIRFRRASRQAVGWPSLGLADPSRRVLSFRGSFGEIDIDSHSKTRRVNLFSQPNFFFRSGVPGERAV